MNNLPEIIDHNGKKAVSARELYLALGFDPTNWAKWYPKNITENPFTIENQDYLPLVLSTKTQNQPENSGGRPTKDFALTIEFAKRLAMMARTQEGEKVRDYFIQCEKKLLEPNDDMIIYRAINILKDRTIALEAKVEEQIKVIEEQKPKVEHVDKVLQSDSLITTTTIAKEIGMTAYKLNQILYNMRVIYPHNKTWMLYAQYDHNEYTKTKTHVFNDGFGVERTHIQTVWTEKGRLFIHRMIDKWREKAA